MKKEEEKKAPTLLTHGASSPSGALAAEVIALVLAGAPVQAGVGAAGLVALLENPAPDMADGGGWRQCAHGGGCRGGGG